jgi:hypothetical protein
MERNDDRRGKRGLTVFLSTVTCLISAACGKTAVFDTRKDSSVLGDASNGDRGSDRIAVASEAVAKPGCSPNDASAVSIHFGVERPTCDGVWHGGFVAVGLWQTSWDHLKPGTYDIGGTDTFVGTATYGSDQGANDWQLAKAGVLTIESIDSTRMTGHCEATFPGGTLSVDFSAQWCGGHEECG